MTDGILKEIRKKVMVLKKTVDEDKAWQIIDSKKTGAFRSMLKRPKKDDVHIHSLDLYYECHLIISGKYVADYYRKAIHTISVDSNVKEAVLGDGTFPIKTKSAFEKAFVGKRGRNKIDLQIEEHVFVEEQDEIVLDHHGRNVKIPYKTSPDMVENYSSRLISKNQKNVRRSEITTETGVSRLQDLLKKPLDPDVRDLTEEFSLQKVVELYVPVFESRLIGPKKKIVIMRLDAVRNKIL